MSAPEAKVDEEDAKILAELKALREMASQRTLALQTKESLEPAVRRSRASLMAWIGSKLDEAIAYVEGDTERSGSDACLMFTPGERPPWCGTCGLLERQHGKGRVR